MGPDASVLVRDLQSAGDREAVMRQLQAIFAPGPDQPKPWPGDLWVSQTLSIGGRYSGETRPFLVGINDPEFYEAEEFEQFQSTFGFKPATVIGISAGCNSDEDHRILGELALYLAEQFAGIIDFGGHLLPPLPASMKLDPVGGDWRKIEPYFQAMVSQLRGRVIASSYGHMADAEFLRNWLDHPNFRMIK